MTQLPSSFDRNDSVSLPFNLDFDHLGAFELITNDKEWIVRNVLGGMSAGFGLRVILDIHPSFITLIILLGWAIKSFVSGLISGWIGGNVTPEAWLESSIP
jgi:hypothetical protein